MTVKPVPEKYTSIAPYLVVDDARRAIDFYKRAFAATECGAMTTPDGRIAHAELQIGDTIMRLCDNLPQFDGRAPKDLGGTTVEIFLFVEDVDAVVRRAGEAGAAIKAQPENQYWGDRLGRVTDPFGHVWLIASRIEDLTPEEIEARGREFFAKLAASPRS
jgi:PhnB protein